LLGVSGAPLPEAVSLLVQDVADVGQNPDEDDGVEELVEMCPYGDCIAQPRIEAVD